MGFVSGEHISEVELAECLTLLLGDDYNNFEVKSLEEILPETISLSQFASQLLGLDDEAVSIAEL